MDTKKHTLHTLKYTLEYFGISRSTLYKTLRKEGITTIKKGRIACLSETDFTHLKNTCFSPKNKVSHETDKNTLHETHENSVLIRHLQQQIEAEQKKNDILHTENKMLIQDVGRWEGVARTLQDQNQKLLELKPEEENGIEEAEIIEPISEKKAEEIGMFRKILNFRF